MKDVVEWFSLDYPAATKTFVPALIVQRYDPVGSKVAKGDMKT
jgi:hypothetical protein